MRAGVALACFLTIVRWVGGCSDSVAPAAPVETVTVSPFAVVIAVGDTVRVSATAQNAAGVVLHGRVVEWTSGESRVATVSRAGLVTAMADGVVSITATIEGRRGTAIITVGTPPPPAAGLLISEPVPTPQPPPLSARAAGVSAAAEDSIAFVSLSPTTVPLGDIATVSNLETKLSLTTAVSDGGFDPVAIGAHEGDSLLVVVRDDAGAVVLEAQTMVAATRRPIVVRTDPPPRKRDVPLNSVMVVVFSEPVDPASLTASSIMLLQGSTPVAGTVRRLDGSGLVGGFEPSSPLAPNTDYRLVVTSAVRDLSGEVLEPPPPTDFTTGTAVATGAASITLAPSLIEGWFPLTTLIRASVRDAQGNVLVGSNVHWASSDSSVATVTPTGGASGASTDEASLTLRAGGTATIIAESEGLADSAVVRSYPFPPGSVRVTTLTSGEDLDPNGYAVALPGGGSYLLANGSSMYTGVPPGERSVELMDVASNCVVNGPNPQTVTVVSLDTAELTFAVTCTAGLPSLRVAIATTGVAIDPDGYTLYIWAYAVPGGVPPLNGAVTYSGMTPGERLVELRDIASNCAVSGPNPKTVTIVRGATAELAFPVTCVGGSVRVTTATTGVELDPDGYVTVVPGDSQPVPINGSVTRSGIVPGPVPVELGGVAGNCAVTGNNPRMVTVTAGATTDVAFDVTCAAGSASIRVTTATTGLGLDPDGYEMSVDGEPGHSVAPNGALTISALSAGDHLVALSGAAANCAIDGANPRAVSVAASSTADAAFTVACVARFVSVAADGVHTCGVISGGAAYCWGDNYYGQLGDGTSKSWRYAPVPVVGGLMFASLAAGFHHTCGLTAAGEAYCWGDNYSGELGDGTRTSRLTAVLVSGGLTFVALDAAYDTTCGLTSGGTVYCWGQAGVGDQGSLTPTLVPGGLTFSSISLGADGWCGLTLTGAMHCSLGNVSGTPLAVSGAPTFVTISVGWNYQCGVTPSGGAYCWGRNDVGQVGSPPTMEGCADAGWTIPCALSPVAVMGGLTFSSVAASVFHTCGLTPAGVAYCWGDNAQGQLGNGSTLGGPAPVAVAGGLTFVQLSLGQNHSCGLATDGTLYCWGYGFGSAPGKVAGQL